MIKSLAIRNYQSHKNSTLEFDPGVNVIIGKSDSGKSSTLRATEWVTKNRPTGDDFRSYWGGETEVEIWLNNNQQIRRYKDKVNTYFLGLQEFKAIKTDVPEEIQKALNLSDVNLQRQLDGHFLLTSTPGDVARHFNKVAKLDKIDEGVKNINSWIRQIEQNIKAYEMNIESSEKKLEDYAHLEKFETAVEALEQLEKQRNVKSANISGLESLIEEIKTINDDLAYGAEVVEMEAVVINTLDLVYKRDALEDGPIAEINGILDGVEGTENNIAAAKNTLVELEKQFEEEFPEVCPLCNTNLKNK